MIRKISLLAALALTGWQPVAAADYSFTVEPSYPADQAEAVYKPLLDYLGKTTGHRFTLKLAPNYHVHWRDMRANTATDFTFEEAHFTDFRASRFGFEPIARVAEPTNYALLADVPVAEKGLDGLVGYRVVCMPSPSLGYVVLGELYRNPVAQPEVQSVAATWRDGVEMVFAGETEAAMVPGYIAQLYPNLVNMSQSRDFPGRAVSAAKAVPAEVRQAVRAALLELHEDPTLNEVLVELGASRFEPATAAEYTGNQKVLSGVFGYTAAVAPAPEPEPEPAPPPEQ